MAGIFDNEQKTGTLPTSASGIFDSQQATGTLPATLELPEIAVDVNEIAGNAWVQGTIYPLGTIVTYAGGVYFSNTDIPSDANEVPDASVNWTFVIPEEYLTQTEGDARYLRLASATIAQLLDVTLTSPENEQTLVYDNGNWVNHKLTTTNLADIDNTNKADGALLVYDDTSEKYKATRTLSNQNTQIVGGSF